MGYPIFHSQYTAAQIEASIGKTPRIKASTRTWEIWDIATSAYVDTGVSIDTDLFVDPTLTESGYAADAKVTGDKIGELKTALNDKVDNYTNAEFSISNKRISYGSSSVADGAIMTATGFYITDYFPCAPGTVVTFYGMDFYYQTGYRSFVIAFYDVNRGLISGITHVTEDTESSVGIVSATAPAGAAYVAFCTNGLNDGYYAHIYDFNTDDIARKTDLEKIDAEIELIKAGKIDITGNDIIQGSYNASGQVVANSRRIRTNGILEVNAGDILHFVPGSNASQMLFGRFNANKVFIADSPWYTSSANINIPSDGYLIIVFRNTANTDILPSQFDAEVELRKYFADTDANIELNEWQKKTNNARHIKNDSATPLTLLHFSDLHADQTALGRIMNYGKNLVGIDDYICTGDMVGNTATQIESWWPQNVMTCIGNHDAAAYSAETGYDWTALSIADRIAYYIAPFESNWDITRGSGQSYYCKDYVTQKVRLIVLDSQIYISSGADATAQTQWLSDLLASAITGNYHVLIAIHAPVNNAPVIECGFSRYGRTNMATLNDSCTPQDVVSAVSTAISNGLHFVGYIVGHNHQDYIYKPTDTQIGFCITCAAVSSKAQWTGSDQHRDAQADAFNLITIDTANTLVKIVRCGGADIDDHMRTRKAICFNYSTGEKVGEVL